MRPKRHVATQVISLVLALTLGVAVVPAVAAPTTVADAQAQATAARAKLASMRTKLDSGLTAYNEANADLTKTRREIAANSKRLAEVRASLKAGQAALDSQATFLYRTDGTGFVDVLLGEFSQLGEQGNVLRAEPMER